MLLHSLEEDHHVDLRGAPLVPRDDHPDKALEAEGVTDEHPDATPDETLAPQGEKIDIDLRRETLAPISGDIQAGIEDAPLRREIVEAFAGLGEKAEGAHSLPLSP